MNNRIGIDDNGTQTWTVYNGKNPYADFNGSGTLTERYVSGPGVVNGKAVDELLARTSSGGATAWYMTDKLGSVRDVVSSSGSDLDHIIYDSFGNIVSETNASDGDRFKYAGMEYDSVTGQYYDRARYYNPATGRFDIQDPKGFAARDMNLYRYVGNGPTDATDPTGMDSGGQEQAMLTGAGTGVVTAYYLTQSLVLVPGGLPIVFTAMIIGGIAGGIYGYALGANAHAGVQAGISGIAGGIAGGLTGNVAAKAIFWTLNAIGILTKSPWNCFPAGTQVLMASETCKGDLIACGTAGQVRENDRKKAPSPASTAGVGLLCSTASLTKSIEDVVPGDVVMAMNPCTGSTEPRRVLRTFCNLTGHIRSIRLKGADNKIRKIETTDGHPFWVDGKGWVLAKDLHSGQNLVQEDRGLVTVVSSKKVRLPGLFPVFNFSVEGLHNYFVSDKSDHPAVLVHNSSFSDAFDEYGQEVAEQSEQYVQMYRNSIAQSAVNGQQFYQAMLEVYMEDSMYIYQEFWGHVSYWPSRN